MHPEQARDAIAHAGNILLNPMTPQGLALRQAVAQRQGHHPETIERGLRDTLQNLQEEVTELASKRPDGDTIGTHAVVLAGNVFTLALRPVAVGLLAGVRTCVKPASPGDPFVEFFWSALTQADAEVGKLLNVARFSSDDSAALDSFLSGADHVSAYGGYESLAAIESKTTDGQGFTGHGPGFGAIAVSQSEMGDLAELTDAIAHDMVAYDQMGCLSPHVIWFDGSTEGALALAEALNVALEDRADTVAHHLASSVAVEALRWRSHALADTLLGDRSHAIWLRDNPNFRPSPSHRHITIACCSALERQLAIDNAGALLKAIATPSGELGALCVSERNPPRISAIGNMQSPPLDNFWDGRSLWNDLYR